MHLTSIVNGAMTEEHLCGQCAAAAGITGHGTEAAGDIQNMLSQALEASKLAPQILGQGGGAAKCPHCGTTADEIRRTGKLGCPRDYEVFGGMQGLVAAAQAGATRHVGKVPGTASPETKLAVLTARAEHLQGRLDGAVRREDYESAAKLRDEIGTTREEIARLA